MAYHIMIVEDEYWTARDLAAEALDRGAVVAGPLSSVPKAISMVAGEERPDVAILDVQLRADEVFPLADCLLAAGVPFLFATGYEKHEIPERFWDIPHLVKPFKTEACVTAALALAAETTYSPH